MNGSALFFYFMVYSFAGWVLEHAYSGWNAGRLKGEGFLRGPFKPMYGIAIVLLLIGKQAGLSPITMIVLAFFVPSIVEYISGMMLDKLFHRRYWDYTNNRYQLHGYVCLKFSLYWLLLSLGVLSVIHPVVVGWYNGLAPVWQRIELLVLLYLLADLGAAVYSRKVKRTADAA